jgi:membrane protease YdiL (CAAX protease family)
MLRFTDGIRPLLAWFNVHDLPLVRAKWRLESALQMLAWWLIWVCSMFLLASALQAFTGAVTGEHSILSLVVSSLSLHGSVLVLVPFFLRRERIALSEAFGFSVGIRRALLMGAVAAFFFIPVGYLLQHASSWIITTMLHQVPMQEQAVQVITENRAWIKRAWLAVFAILIAPVAEETLFRGILYPTVKQMGYPRLAMWGVAVLFGLIHFNLVALVPLTLFGIVLALLYERTGNLLSSILAHSLFNGFGFIYLLIVEKNGL